MIDTVCQALLGAAVLLLILCVVARVLV